MAAAIWARPASFVRYPSAPARERRQDVGFFGIGGEHDDRGLGMGGADAGGRGDAVAAGHAQVHEHDVGAVFVDESGRFVTVGGGAHDLDVVEQAEQQFQTFAHGRLVVGDDDPYSLTLGHARRRFAGRGRLSNTFAPTSSLTPAAAPQAAVDAATRSLADARSCPTPLLLIPESSHRPANQDRDGPRVIVPPASSARSRRPVRPYPPPLVRQAAGAREPPASFVTASVDLAAVHSGAAPRRSPRARACGRS